MYPNQNIQVNVRDFVDNPSRVERVLTDLTKDRTIADYAFSAGDAHNGAVIYDEVLGHPEDQERDVEVIAPGAEFPLVGITTEDQKTAKVDKYGGAAELTFEAIRRNDQDTLAKRMTIISNLIVKRVNKVTVNALVTNPNVNTLDIDTDWGQSSTDPIADLFAAKGLIDDNELGYTGNLYLINPLDAQQYLLGRKDIREQVQKEGEHPVLSGDLGNLAGGEWIKTSTIARGEIWLLERGVSGSVRDEEGGIKSHSYDEDRRHVKVIQGWRSIVPIITDPKSVTKITGFRAA
ncbi:major capsid protein [Arthrobacter sulfonylureivorans]|uniref:major capsid protein n=1 Tax=Arthrobacter sulfonylureivorans TaxID=2486855 RepID=UPI0039E68B59